MKTLLALFLVLSIAQSQLKVITGFDYVAKPVQSLNTNGKVNQPKVKDIISPKPIVVQDGKGQESTFQLKIQQPFESLSSSTSLLPDPILSKTSLKLQQPTQIVQKGAQKEGNKQSIAGQNALPDQNLFYSSAVSNTIKKSDQTKKEVITNIKSSSATIPEITQTSDIEQTIQEPSEKFSDLVLQQNLSNSIGGNLIPFPKFPDLPEYIEPEPFIKISKPIRSKQLDLELLNDDPLKQGEYISGIIVSFTSRYSYDQLFHQVKQESKQGSKVLVYLASADSVHTIHQGFEGYLDESNRTYHLLFKMIEQINQLKKQCPNCIIFNWECSSGYGGKTFTQGQSALFGFLKYALDQGFMTMFSDFSLKALINQWDRTVLGPNPFVQIKQTSESIDLRFQKDVLKRSPSSQLQTVADLAKDGQVRVNVLGGTIVYAVDENVKTEKYELEVLTVASNFRASRKSLQSSVGQYEGTAGHVLLTYPSGGHLLTSMGHWVELMKVDTSAEQLFRTAEVRYGKQYADDLKSSYSSIQGAGAQQEYLNQNAKLFIQNQSPAANLAYLNKAN